MNFCWTNFQFKIFGGSAQLETSLWLWPEPTDQHMEQIFQPATKTKSDMFRGHWLSGCFCCCSCWFLASVVLFSKDHAVIRFSQGDVISSIVWHYTSTCKFLELWFWNYCITGGPKQHWLSQSSYIGLRTRSIRPQFLWFKELKRCKLQSRAAAVLNSFLLTPRENPAPKTRFQDPRGRPATRVYR